MDRFKNNDGALAKTKRFIAIIFLRIKLTFGRHHGNPVALTSKIGVDVINDRKAQSLAAQEVFKCRRALGMNCLLQVFIFCRCD